MRLKISSGILEYTPFFLAEGELTSYPVKYLVVDVPRHLAS